jgi:mxaD protein
MKIQALRLAAFAAVGAITTSFAVSANPPTELKVVEKVILTAPLDRVWATVKDFDGVGKWHPAVDKVQLLTGSSEQPGTIRALTLKDGTSIKEQLVSFNETLHRFTYTMVESPFPITDYMSTLSVQTNAHGKTVVRWTGTFKRKNPADPPPEAESDAAGIALVQSIYQGGLSNLKKMYAHP